MLAPYDPFARLRQACVATLCAAGAIACDAGEDSRRSAGPPDPAASYPILTTAPESAKEKLGGLLQRRLSGESRESVRVLIDLSEQLDLVAFGERMRAAGLSRIERRQAVLEALSHVARRSQARLDPLLERLTRRGEISYHRGYPIVNRLVVEATPRALEALAERPEVAFIVEESAEPVFGLAADPRWQTAAQEANRSAWALESLGVPEARDRGLEGRGVVVGIIDEGASATHEQLADGYRGGECSWLDPSGRHDRPTDGAHGHGTSVLSVAVGSAPADASLGVAPGARWVACAGIPGGLYDNVAFTECAEWMLTVGQPDVLINAWMLPSEGCDPSLRRIVDTWRAAEILPVFAAGNLGPAPATDRSPANYTGLYPGEAAALAVGAHTRLDEAYEHSSRGPGSCDGSTYPAIAAPGADIQTAFPLSSTTYLNADGTSVAAGFAAGAAALLLESHPDSWVWELEEALRRGAKDLGPAGPDDEFGFGRLWLPGALEVLEGGGLRSDPGAPAHDSGGLGGRPAPPAEEEHEG